MPLRDVIRRYRHERSLVEWASYISWAVTTIEECDGQPPANPPTGYALYDAGEDDPAIGVFTFRKDAENIAEILHEYGKRA